MTLGQLLALGPSLCLLLPSEQRDTEAASFWETQGSPDGSPVLSAGQRTP